jgi:hypothetical protein
MKQKYLSKQETAAMAASALEERNIFLMEAQVAAMVEMEDL